MKNQEQTAGPPAYQRDINAYQDATLIMQLLRDNLILWQSSEGSAHAAQMKRAGRDPQGGRAESAMSSDWNL